MGWDGMGLDEVGWDGIGWDAIGLDWIGLDEMRWDGMVVAAKRLAILEADAYVHLPPSKSHHF